MIRSQMFIFSSDAVLKGVVRLEKIEDPEQYIAAILSRVKREHVIKTYREYIFPLNFGY